MAIDETSSPAELIRAGRDAHARAEDPSLRQAVELLEASNVAADAAAAALKRALVERDDADEALDSLVSDLSLRALELTGGDPGHALFRRLFPEGPQSVTCVTVREEISLVRALLDGLADHPLASFRAPLESAVQAAQSADDHVERALASESAAFAAVRRATVALLQKLKLDARSRD